MDAFTIVKGTSRLQKQSMENLFDTWILFQDFTKRASGYWSEKLGLQVVHETVDPYWKVLQRGRHDARQRIADAFDELDACLTCLDPKFAERKTRHSSSLRS